MFRYIHWISLWGGNFCNFPSTKFWVRAMIIIIIIILSSSSQNTEKEEKTGKLRNMKLFLYFPEIPLGFRYSHKKCPFWCVFFLPNHDWYKNTPFGQFSSVSHSPVISLVEYRSELSVGRFGNRTSSGCSGE